MPRDTFLNLPPEKREHIAEVAIEAFAAEPYARVSISRLVVRAGIAKGSFYQYFDSKGDLFRWLLYDVVARRKLEYLRGAPIPAGGDFFALLGHLIMGGVRFALTDPRLGRLAAQIWHSGDPELQGLRAEFEGIARANMKAVLAQGQASGHVRPDLDLDLAADLLVAVLQMGMDLALQRLVGMDLMEFCASPERVAAFTEARLAALVEGAVDMLRRGLGAPLPPGSASIDLDQVPFRPGQVTR